MVRFADVALPVAIDREFTYSIPGELRDSAIIGARVVVPFGRKLATGLIVGLPEKSSVPGLKPIREILDATPLVPPDLLRLCRWIAEYYFAPLGEVLKAANPGAFARPSSKSVTLAPSATDEAIAQSSKRAPARERILSLLLKHGSASSSDLARRSGVKNINAVLNALERSGLVVTEEILPLPGTASKMKEFLLLDSVDDTLLERQISSLSSRNKRGLLLLSTVRSLRDQGIHEVAVADILKKTGASSRTMHSFRDTGLLAIANREVRRQQDFGTEEQTLGITLNANQQQVRDAIAAAVDSSAHKTFLLHGVTASGKTQVYIEAIRHTLARGKSAIVLVPEISLTPQIVRRFKSHFADEVSVVHSRMSTAERREVWRLAQRGDCRIVIGPRSAIFAPLRNLGLIVVDEEHEATYKQFDATPRYHARDVAVVRGTMGAAVVVLGSATPSAESYHNALAGKYELLELPHRIDDVPMPQITIVDLTAERKQAYAAMKESLPHDQRAKLKEFRQPSISNLLQSRIADRIARKEGIILLQNRRGFAPFVECPDCGHTETCDNCNVTLTYHLAKKHLRCHYCGLIRQPYILCPSCGGANVELQGVGTQRVEQELALLFPEARILRMDLDTTTRKGAHDRILRKFGDREADILLGTQMVAKGLDFPHVTLVGVISADTQMLLPDFRSAERTFQLLAQVAGRAGRAGLLGEVIIQTRQPKHTILAHVIDHNFKAYYEEELVARKELDYPPFSRLVLIETKGTDEGTVKRAAESFSGMLKGGDGVFAVLGPAPAVIGKIKNQYRWHIIVKDLKSRDAGGHHLRAVLQRARASFEGGNVNDVRLIIDVDPAGLM
jgi:primosomal protein N' (replication factor Y)